jgi:predicted Zn-dependent protease
VAALTILRCVLMLAALTAGAQEPPEAMARARQAYESARVGNADDAISKLRAAAKLAPGNALYRSALGGIFKRRGKLVAADLEFTAALKLDPANPVLLFESASIGSELEQFEAARGSLAKFVELQPENVWSALSPRNRHSVDSLAWRTTRGSWVRRGASLASYGKRCHISRHDGFPHLITG